MNSRSAAAIGSRPLLSTASSRTVSLAAAAATICGRKNVGIVVGDDDRGVLGEGREQTAAGAGFGFEIGEVRHPARRKGGGVVGHPVDHEPVQPVGRPPITAPQRLEHQQRFAETAGPPGGALEPEVEPGPSGGDHPVEDPRAILSDRRGIRLADPGLRDLVGVAGLVPQIDSLNIC